MEGFPSCLISTKGGRLVEGGSRCMLKDLLGSNVL